LVGAEEVEVMAGKTWDFGPSLMIKKMILELEKDGWVPQGRAKLPQGKTVPTPGKDYAVVFRDYFACSLRLPSVQFLHEVPEQFDVQIHQLTPNGFLTISKFC
jgi:hypothetical protein